MLIAPLLLQEAAEKGAIAAPAQPVQQKGGHEAAQEQKQANERAKGVPEEAANAEGCAQMGN